MNITKWLQQRKIKTLENRIRRRKLTIAYGKSLVKKDEKELEQLKLLYM